MEVNDNGKDPRYDLLCQDLAGQIDGVHGADHKLLKTADGMGVSEVIAALGENLDSIEDVYDNLLEIDGIFLSTARET